MSEEPDDNRKKVMKTLRENFERTKGLLDLLRQHHDDKLLEIVSKDTTNSSAKLTICSPIQK